MSWVDVKIDQCDFMFLISLPVPGLKGNEWTELGSWVTSSSSLQWLSSIDQQQPQIYLYYQNPHTRGEFAFDELGIASTVVQRREDLENKQNIDYRTPESSVGFRIGGQRWLL